MRKLLSIFLTSLMALFIILSNNAYSYNKLDLATIECLKANHGSNYNPNLNRLPECHSIVNVTSNPIRELAEKEVLAHLKELSFKDGINLKNSNFYIEPNLNKNYLNYSKSAIGLSEEFWGSRVSNPVAMIISSKSNYYRDALCEVYYKLNIEKRENCKVTPIEQFGNFWPSEDNPNVFGGVFNIINESDSKGNNRVDYPALFIFLNQNEKNQVTPNPNYTRTILHEYAHIAQYGFLGDHKPTNYINNNFMSNSPALYTEGSAQYVGTVLNHLYFNGSYDISFKNNASWVKNNYSIKDLYLMNKAEIYKDSNLSEIYYSGGLMSELFLANFGLNSFFLLNSCLTLQKTGEPLIFEKCFARITGYNFLEWSALATNYVKSIYNSEEINLEDFQLSKLDKVPDYDIYEVEKVSYLKGKVELKFKVNFFGKKEVSNLNLYSVKGLALCKVTDLYCSVYNSQIINNLLYLSGDGIKEDFKIDLADLKPPLPSIANLSVSLDNSSNHISGGMGLDNALLSASWDKIPSELMAENGGGAVEPVVAVDESYLVEVDGCGGERKVFITNRNNFQIPCTNTLTSLTDSLVVSVRVNNLDGVSEKSEFVYHSNSIFDLIPAKDVKISYLRNNLKFIFKEYFKAEFERKLKIEKIIKNTVETSYKILDESNNYDLTKLVDGNFDKVKLSIILRAKGESNSDYGVAVISNSIELKFNQINYRSESPTPLPVPKVIATSTPTSSEVKVENGLKKVPMKSKVISKAKVNKIK